MGTIQFPFCEALRQMSHGFKCRRAAWEDKNYFMAIDIDYKMLINSDVDEIFLCSEDLFATDWEIYVKPIGDKKATTSTSDELVVNMSTDSFDLGAV